MAYEGSETYAFAYQAVQAKAPNASGVYTIYSSQQWIYVGEGDDIRQSLFGHLNEPSACISRRGPSRSRSRWSQPQNASLVSKHSSRRWHPPVISPRVNKSPPRRPLEDVAVPEQHVIGRESRLQYSRSK